MAVLEPSVSTGFALKEADVVLRFTKDRGPGGQHRNKSSTAIRLTHRPSGLVVSAEDSRSQWQNLQSAKAKLVEALRCAHDSELMGATSEQRNAQIRSCERPAKS